MENSDESTIMDLSFNYIIWPTFLAESYNELNGLVKTINLVNKTVVVNTTNQQFMNLISSAFFIFHM